VNWVDFFWFVFFIRLKKMNTPVGAGTHAFDFYFNFNLLEQPLNIKIEVKSVFSFAKQGSE